jgi:hypothetical protein
VLSNAGVHVATSATSLKNIFIDSAKKGHTYAQVIDNIAKNSDKLTYANKKFGKRSVVSALVLAQKMHDAKNGVTALTEEFKKAELGLTSLIAADRLNTFRGAQKLLNAAWHEFVLSIEDGNGPLAQSLTRILKVASAVLLLSSDSDQAREAVSKLDSGILSSAKRWMFWLKIIKWVAIALIAAKVVLTAWSGAIGLWNIGVVVAAGAMKLWTAAVWLFNAAWAANPIGLIIIAIAALVAVVLSAVSAYNDWGAALLFLMGPMLWIINAVQSIRRNWDAIGEAFNSKGILVGMGTIAAVLIDSILMPLQQIAKIIYDLTGAKWAGSAIADIEAFRNKLGVNVTSDESGKLLTPKINPKSTDQDATAGNKDFNGRVWVDFNDTNGAIKNVKSDSTFIMPRVSTTNSFE